MSPLLALFYGLLMLSGGVLIGGVLVAVVITAAHRHPERGAAMIDRGDPHSSWRGWVEPEVAQRAAEAAGEYVGRHAAGIARGTQEQQLAILAQVERLRCPDVTGELERILTEPDPAVLVIESPTGFAAWMAATHQPWGVVDDFEEARS